MLLRSCGKLWVPMHVQCPRPLLCLRLHVLLLSGSALKAQPGGYWFTSGGPTATLPISASARLALVHAALLGMAGLLGQRAFEDRSSTTSCCAPALQASGAIMIMLGLASAS